MGNRQKSKNPPCPKCESSLRVKFNGYSNFISENIKKQFKCNACSHTWVVPVDPDYDKLLPIHKLRPQDWEAIELFVVGHTCLEIKEETGIKQQTFKRKLKAIFRRDIWSNFKVILLTRMGSMWEDEVDRLFKTLKEDAEKKPVFRRIGQLKKLRNDPD